MPNYRLVQRAGVDTLHKWPATERCNLDDTERDTGLDVSETQAWELVGNGTVLACQHCFPPEQLTD